MEKVPMNAGMGGPSRYNSANAQQASPVPGQPGASLHFASPRRKYTTGSDPATSPTVQKARPNPLPPVPPIPLPHVFPAQQFLHLLPQTRNLAYYPAYHSGAQVTTSHIEQRGTSPSGSGVSPTRRRLNSHSPDRGTDRLSSGGSLNGANGWIPSGRRSNGHRNNAAVNRSSAPYMHANGRKEPTQPMMRRPSNKKNGSTQTVLSSSMPSTPSHHPQLATGKSRSPSPPSCLLDSPKSAASEPLPSTLQPPLSSGKCKYETALINCRRRFQYKIGYGYLPFEKPIIDKLSEEEDRKLTREMNDLYQRLLPTSDSNERRKKFVLKLEKLLNSEWPGHNIRVNVFGSSENKLCTTDSDVDICITTNWKELEQTCKLAKGLAKHGMERVVCVPGAKVPIVKIWDPELSVACDMNVNNTLALENTRMIKTYVEIDPRVRPLAMIIKHWTKQRILNDAAGGATFGSYTWICMILNFLQTRDPPILPSLHERPHKKGPIINNVDCSFDDDIEGLRGFGSRNKESLGSLLFGFFKQYGHTLDYEKDVISVRRGKIVTKVEKGWQYGQNNWLCVEEPFNVGRNLGNTADAYSVKGLHLEFRRAFKILAEGVDLKTCCAQYLFPPEEPPAFVLPPQVQKTSVRMSQASSTSNRGRGGHSGGSGRGGRSYGGYNAKQNQFRRASNGPTSHASVPAQPQYIPVNDMYSLHASQLQHLYQLDASQIQAHMQAQAQAHMAAIQTLQTQAQLHANGLHASAQPPGPQESGSAPISSLPAIAYYAHMLGFPFYFSPQLQVGETSTVPASPTFTSSLPDTRQGLGRGRHFGNYPARSRSQPPPTEINSTAFIRADVPIALVHPSDDELEYNDLSSNGSITMNQSHVPPETPPDEISDEYVGYYSIGESLQEELESTQAALGGDAFIEQNCIVDQQKRLSHDRISPLHRPSRTPSPLPVDRVQSQQLEDCRPLIMSGNSSRTDSILKASSLDKLPEPDMYLQGNSPSQLRLDTSHTSLSPPVIPIPSQYPPAMSPSRTAFAPSTGSIPPACIPLDDGHESGNSSPLYHQSSMCHQIPWSNARIDTPKSRTYASTQEDVSLLLAPVPEVTIPSTPSLRKRTDLPASETPEERAPAPRSTVVNGVKTSPRPGTKKQMTNGIQNNGPHRPPRAKAQGPNPASALMAGSNSVAVSEALEAKDNAKANGFVLKKKKAKKTKKPGPMPGKIEMIPETERKGG